MTDERYPLTEAEISAILPYVSGDQLQLIIQRGLTVDERRKLHDRLTPLTIDDAIDRS